MYRFSSIVLAVFEIPTRLLANGKFKSKLASRSSCSLAREADRRVWNCSQEVLIMLSLHIL